MSTRQLAEKFVREQIQIMKRYGTATRLNATQRRNFVASVQRTFETLRAERTART